MRLNVFRTTHCEKSTLIVIGALLFAVVFIMPDSRSYADIHELKVGIYDFKPLGFVDTDGKGKGFFIDILDGIAIEQKWIITYIPGTFNQCLTRLKSKEIDLLAGVAYSDERAQEFDFTSKHLFIIWAEIYKPEKSPIKAINDLDAKKIGVVKGAHVNIELAQLLKGFGISAHLQEYGDYDDVLQSLDKSQSDVGVFTNLYGFQIDANHKVERTQIFFAPTQLRFAVKKGCQESLLSTLDSYFTKYQKTPEAIYQNAYNKWISKIESIHGRQPAIRFITPAWVYLLLSALALFSMILVGFNRILKRRVESRTYDLVRHNEQLRLNAEVILESQMRIQKNDEEIQALIKTLVQIGGREFFDTLVVELCSWLKCNCAIIGEIADGNSVRVTAMVVDGNHVSGYSYKLNGTPCEQAINKSYLVYLENVCEVFPDDHKLTDMGASGYAGVPLRDRSGKSIGILCAISRDRLNITEHTQEFMNIIAARVSGVIERQNAENALRESEERFKALHNASFGGIAIHDRGMILECNQGLSEMTGYSTDELIGMNGLLLISEKTRDMVMNNILACYEKPYEAVGLRKNGEEFPMRLEGRDIPYKEKIVRVVEFRDITEQKRMEEELRINIIKYRTLFDVLPVGITVSDNAGNILESNNAADKILGLPREEYIKRKIDSKEWCIIREDGASMPSEDFAAIIALKENALVENVVMGIVKDNNEVTWLSVSSTPVPLDGYGVVIAYSDISERKKAEDQYITLFREMLDGFALHEIICDANGKPIDYKFLTVNPAFERMTGLQADDIVDKRVLEVLPATEKYWIDIYGKVAITGEPSFFEHYSDELKKYFEVKAFRPAYGQFACVISDITERRNIENDLRESEEKYRSIMESMDDAAFICSSEHRIEYMNPAILKRIGHSSIGDFCYKVIYGFNEQCPWCSSKKVLSGKSVRTEIINPRDNKTYSVSISPVFHTDNSVSVLSVLRDVTETKMTEAKLQQAQKMEAIGVLAGGIAHDFNNILFPIIGYTEMLSYEISQESPLRSMLDEIYAASMRAKDMVRQILTFSRQEQSELKLMKMQHIVKEALKLIRSTIPATIDIKSNIRKECGLINADPTQIHQIVMNLVTNAYHAMEETGGTMTISLKEVQLNEQEDIGGQDIKKGIYACLTVSDTGKGIPADIMEKIFDPFFTTKKQGKGTGLGLSSVHGIVNNAGGTIRVYSEIGKGTEFNIYLPVVESYLKKNDAIQAKRAIHGGTERILLVDDEAALIALEKGMLERLGYQVTSRISSTEALEVFSSNPDKFDMVITDMAMPSMSGDKLALELIKIRPDIPILLCTGFSTIMSEEQALSMGIKGFLMKPVTTSDIDKKIRAILD